MKEAQEAVSFLRCNNKPHRQLLRSSIAHRGDNRASALAQAPEIEALITIGLDLWPKALAGKIGLLMRFPVASRSLGAHLAHEVKPNHSCSVVTCRPAFEMHAPRTHLDNRTRHLYFVLCSLYVLARYTRAKLFFQPRLDSRDRRRRKLKLLNSCSR